jgi:rubredoxin
MSDDYWWDQRYDAMHYALTGEMPWESTDGMSYPMRCRHCSHVHDGAKVTVVGRYTDCSTWRCPGCNVLIDDRPRAWGGSAIPVGRGR